MYLSIAALLELLVNKLILRIRDPSSNFNDSILEWKEKHLFKNMLELDNNILMEFPFERSGLSNKRSPENTWRHLLSNYKMAAI